MADFGDKIQALMDEVYDAWKKDENKGKSKWDVLGDFSEAHQIAVVFGNFNYQVGNGGLEQWIYNGYFQDDAEKLTEYLEAGSDLDDRCRTILDRVYKLDEYANETDCDRYGYYEDPDNDGESSFTGDMINCDAFDTWYYEHCGKDDWWEVVGGIIDKTEGRDAVPVHQDEHSGADPDGAVRTEFIIEGEDNKRMSETVENPAINYITTDELKHMREKEGLILRGCGGDPAEWLNGINNTLTEAGILQNGGKFKGISVFEHDGLKNILFNFDGVEPADLNVGKLEMWRLQTHETFGGTWLSDYLPNHLGINMDAPEIYSQEQFGDIDLGDMPPIAVDAGSHPQLNHEFSSGSGDYEHGGEAPIPEPDWTIRAEFVYAGENNSRISETVEYPTTKERIDSLLANAGIDGIHERVFYVELVDTVIPGLADALPDDWLHNEINYLAANIKAMTGEERECFAACIDAKKTHGDITQLINISCKDNITELYLQPAFSEEQYGDFRLDVQKDETSGIFRQFEASENPDERAFAEYVLLLEAAVNPAELGRTVAKNENGVFTEQGYLTGSGDLQELYRGPEDIPFEYLVYEEMTSELNSLSKYIPEDADKSELAYLADKMTAMDGEQRRLFDAATETGQYCGSVAEIINLTENLDCFNLHLAFNESEYGEYRLGHDWDESAEAIRRLEKSTDPSDQALSKYITLLNRCADDETYGHHASQEDGGIFTSHGLLTQECGLEEKYRGVQDLPDGYRKTAAAPETDRRVAPAERPASGEKPSVMAQIAEAREAQRNNPEPREPSAPGKKKSEPEL